MSAQPGSGIILGYGVQGAQQVGGIAARRVCRRDAFPNTASEVLHGYPFSLEMVSLVFLQLAKWCRLPTPCRGAVV